MKKAIKRFWGIGLIIIMLSSLFMMVASPVSAADPLRWEAKTGGPSTAFQQLTSSTTYDVAISPDTKTIYGACGTKLLQSANGGSTYTDITSRLPAGYSTANILYVTMAPDDPNTVVVVSANSTNQFTAISVNGGATFTDMGMTNSGTTVIKGVAISPTVTGGFRYIATWGQSSSTVPILYYYNYGSGVGGWRNAATFTTANTTPLDNILAVAFSPNFASDYVAMAVSEVRDTVSSIYGARLHAISFNSNGWDSVISTGYPVTFASTTNASLSIASGSIALGPDFMGGDETLRNVFIGLANTTTNANVDGIWRVTSTSAARQIFATDGINSVAYDGTTLVGGSYASNAVYYATDMLSSAPTFLGSRNLKRIGTDDAGNDQVQVMYVGGALFGTKIGVGGCVSKSTDSGVTWNDFTLIKYTTSYAIDDVMVSADGATWYISLRDANTTAIYRMSPLQRVLTVPLVTGGPMLKLRGLASDPNVVYAFDFNTPATTLYYSADGGVSRWQLRLNVPAAMADLAVESANVIYIGSGVNVYKSINNGFTWNLPVNTTSTTNIYSLLSLGTDKLVAGLTSGVAFSKDGGATWAKNGPPFGSGGTMVAASGLDTGNFIFATCVGGKDVYRCEIGPSNPAYEFKSMSLTQTGGAPVLNAEVSRGFQYVGGVLYVISHNGTAGSPAYLDSILTPTMNPGSTVPATSWRTEYVSNYGNSAGASNSGLTPITAPYDLDTSTSTGKVTLYVVSTYSATSSNYGIYYLDDTLALVGPAVTGPADKSLVQTNSVTGLPLSLNLLWTRPSLATWYEVQVASDNAFVSKLISGSAVTATTGGVISSEASVAMVISGGSYVLNPGSTYYWRVRAVAPLSSAWSETRSFTIQPVAAPVPSLSSPVNGATITNQSPAFSWSPVTGTTQYDFQLSTTPTFGTTILTDQPASAGTLVPVTIKLDQGKQYFWRVRALQPVQGDWSTVGNFFVAVPATTNPPVTITNVPAPTITIPAPSPAPTYTLAPAPINQIAPTYIWAIIIIGAILVIAVIVLVVRTRRSV